MERLLRSLPGVSGATQGDNGQVGVIGGSVEYPGQPTISALAALRTGTDDAEALVSEEIYGVVASHSPNLLVDRFDGERFEGDAVDRALELGEWADTLVIGPGLVDADPAAISETITHTEVPVVVDALAIGPGMEADLSNTVFTPASEEEEWITEEYGSIEALSKETDAVIALTGDVDTIVADGERTTNETGTSALTVAGTGDTMAGIIASLLAQGMNRADAAELGAWILGKSGELASAEYGNGLVATDVIERIPDTLH
ncbi:NAD(P)H-hydrate dehydratase [Halalkalicoccus salilacus]|uniref:NAD(P)H-hydrate dehydratase n=1 Tax=Halalkalicoccus salilacus TaxID=3117459 RepID=UPI00300EC903